MEAVLIALVGAVPATIAAMASWRQSRKTHREVRTNHGTRSGDRIEKMDARTLGMDLKIDSLTVLLADHISDRRRHVA